MSFTCTCLVNLSQDPPHKPNKSPKVNSSPPWVSSLSQDWEWRKVYITKHMMRVAHRKEKLGSQKRSEKAMAPHSSTLAWKIPWTEEPGRLQSMGSLGVDTTERLHFHFSLSCIGEGNGKPLQCSCLENPRDRGAWWAAVSGVAQSRTRLKWLSSSSSSSSRRDSRKVCSANQNQNYDYTY